MDPIQSLKVLTQHLWVGAHWEKGKDGPRCVREPLKLKHVENHLASKIGVGLAPITPGTDVTRCALFDIDDHDKRLEWSQIVSEAVRPIAAAAELLGLRANAFRSSGGKGVHLIFLWEKPQDAYSVRVLMAELLATVGLESGTKGLRHKQIEIFPKQDSVSSGGVGSMFILPFFKESLPLDPMSFEPVDPEWGFDGWKFSGDVPVREKPVKEVVASEKVVQMDLHKLRKALEAIPNTGAEELDYDKWRNVIFAIHWATGGLPIGLEFAHEFSKKSSKYNPGFLDKEVWPYIQSNRGGAVVTENTIYAMAREYGYQDVVAEDFDIVDVPPEPPKGTIDMGDSLPSTAPTSETPGTAAGVQDGNDARGSETPPIATAIELAPVEVKENKELRFQIETPEQFANRPPISWLLKHVLPRAELIVVYGQSGSGKTFLAHDMGGAISQGIDWRDKKTMGIPVVYIAAEGGGGFSMRVKAYLQANNLTSYNMGIISAAPNFLVVDDVKDVIRAIRHYHENPGLVIVDTLARVMPGGNENSGEDMGLVVKHCQEITRWTGATVMLVHHSGKDEAKGARGWSGLKAATDAEIEITQMDNARAATITKMKDGEGGATFGFRLKPVTIGFDEDEEPIESCIVEHIEGKVMLQAGPSKNSVAKGKTQRALLTAIADLQPPDNSGVAEQDVLAVVMKARGMKEAKRSNFTRAIRLLEEVQLITRGTDGKLRLGADSEMNEHDDDTGGLL